MLNQNIMSNQNREQSQQVPLEEGKEKMVEQSVSYDPIEKWISVSHASHDMTMSLENWKRLIELAEKAIKDQTED